MDITKSKLRKRNINRSEEQLQRNDKMSSSDVGNNSNESAESSFLTTLIPKPLRQCIIGVERDLTQNVVLAQVGGNGDVLPVSQSCIRSDLLSSCGQVPETDAKNKPTSCVSARVAVESDVDDTSDTGLLNVSYNTCTTVSSNSDSSNLDSEYDYETSDNEFSFLTFRLSYLFVTLVVMLADGLQGK